MLADRRRKIVEGFDRITAVSRASLDRLSARFASHLPVTAVLSDRQASARNASYAATGSAVRAGEAVGERAQ